MVEVAQSARDAAADYYAGLGFHGDAEKARNGTGFTYTVQAFAAAEQRGHIAGMREAAGIAEAVQSASLSNIGHGKAVAQAIRQRATAIETGADHDR